MIQFDLGLLADHAQADASGKLYIVGEFRYLQAHQVPAIHPHMSVVARWIADLPPTGQLTASLQIDVVDSDGKSIAPRSPVMPVTFSPVGPAERGRGWCTLILNLDRLVLPRFGDYAIHFLLDGQPNGRVPFQVTQLAAPAA